LIVHPKTVAAGLLALKSLQPIPGWYDQIFKARRRIQQLQFTLHPAPQIAGNPAALAGIPFPEQIGGRLIGERLNHDDSMLHG
jgi:hypothetical protein